MPFSEQQTEVAEQQPDDEGDEEAVTANVAVESDEPADGVVEASADEADADAAADEQAAELTVDLRTLEAVLLSTHSPLTAGRLGELLDLPTTKPIRKAI